ncbi:DUF2750 domain-containing protein [Flammeovirgaceae bacterium SG7u.111]|nr:DUF2750 domain-containing protein [Flammeovirgaceae bacterium SG7u.132]WPO33674.1 DUF2750 domain-containing protein [Flammeovirgaceae bacterium SG7u.111]
MHIKIFVVDLAKRQTLFANMYSENDLDLGKKPLQFIKNITFSHTAWGLDSPRGFASIDTGNGIETLCFWSEKEKAEQSAIGDWEGYRLTEIEMGELLENWLVGLGKHHGLACIDWEKDENLEIVSPFGIIIHLIDFYKSSDYEFDFTMFNGLEDIEYAVKDILGMDY